MNPQRFDRFARSVVPHAGRRNAIKGIVGGLAGGMLALVGAAEAGAQQKKPKDCCCSCPPTGHPCRVNVCTSDGECAMVDRSYGTYRCINDQGTEGICFNGDCST